MAHLGGALHATRGRVRANACSEFGSPPPLPRSKEGLRGAGAAAGLERGRAPAHPVCRAYLPRRHRAVGRSLRRSGGLSAGEHGGHQPARPQRHLRAGGLWRRAHALPGLSQGRAAHLGSLRLDRHHLRHHLPRPETADRLRHRGTEAAPAATHRRRRPRRARDHRAQCRLRRHRHDHQLPAERRPHRHRRWQDLHLQRRRGRRDPLVRQMERDRRRARIYHGAHPREGHAWFLHRSRREEDGPPCGADCRAQIRGRRVCPKPISSAHPAAA